MSQSFIHQGRQECGNRNAECETNLNVERESRNAELMSFFIPNSAFVIPNFLNQSFIHQGTISDMFPWVLPSSSMLATRSQSFIHQGRQECGNRNAKRMSFFIPNSAFIIPHFLNQSFIHQGTISDR